MSDAPALEGPCWTIVVAGGSGARFGAPKQFVTIARRRVIDWSVTHARTVSDGVIVVLPVDEVAENGVPGADIAVAGGVTRAESVRNGLAAVPDDAAVVLVHDAARPAASAELFARVVDAVRRSRRAVVPVVPVTDSLRWRAGGALDRADVVAVQTPQGFPAQVLRDAHATGADASDDATLVEVAGGVVDTVAGEVANQKLTNPADLAAIEAAIEAFEASAREEIG